MKHCLHRSLGLAAGIVIATTAAVPAQAATTTVVAPIGSSAASSQSVASGLAKANLDVSKLNLDPRARG